jgi:hypothetical protein
MLTVGPERLWLIFGASVSETAMRPNPRLGGHGDVLLALKVLFNYHSVDPPPPPHTPHPPRDSDPRELFWRPEKYLLL